MVPVIVEMVKASVESVACGQCCRALRGSDVADAAVLQHTEVYGIARVRVAGVSEARGGSLIVADGHIAAAQVGERVAVDVVASLGVDNYNAIGRAGIGRSRMEGVLLDAERRQSVGIDAEVAIGAAADVEVVAHDYGVICVERVDAAGVVVEPGVTDGEHASRAAVVGGMYASVEALEGGRNEILVRAGKDVAVFAI